MRICPVRSHKPPRYPQRELFILKPRLLYQYMPKAWKKCGLVANALMAFILGNTIEDSKLSAIEPVTKSQVSTLQDSLPKFHLRYGIIRQEIKMKVAPIFIHGNGYGMSGCVVIAPPVYISEEEARQIIERELDKFGVSFELREISMREVGIDIKLRQAKFSLEPHEYVEEKDMGIYDPRELIFNGYDRKLNFAYKYVSVIDGSWWSSRPRASTVESIETMRAAIYYNDEIKHTGILNGVIFYDPLMPIEIYSLPDGVGFRKAEKDKKIEAINLLKQQVNDFIEWAQKEGLFHQLPPKAKKGN